MMKVRTLTVRNYRSIHDATIEFGDLNLFIGANASGKSTILDALRFLSEGVRARDFRRAVFSRGGMLNLAWKGEEAGRVEFKVSLEGEKRFEWSVDLVREGYGFGVSERVEEILPDDSPRLLLEADLGEGYWRSGELLGKVSLLQGSTGCALAAASVDASFPGRQVAEFVGRWGFFDPSPFLMRRDWNLVDGGGLDAYGRNLAETLYGMEKSDPRVLEYVVTETRSIVGLPTGIEPRESEERAYFVQHERGLEFPVHQVGVSSGTLRALALMTALYGQSGSSLQSGNSLIGIEEPENYLHPSALGGLVVHIQEARGRVQMLITTHSPLLLDYLDDPAAVNVVRRDVDLGTVVLPEPNPEGVRKGLEMSGFSLGQYHETKGFGG